MACKDPSIQRYNKDLDFIFEEAGNHYCAYTLTDGKLTLMTHCHGKPITDIWFIRIDQNPFDIGGYEHDIIATRKRTPA